MFKLRIMVSIVLVAASGVMWVQGQDGVSAAQTPTSETASADPLARFGVHVTEGAAAGYVDDRVCSRCHADLARSYQDVAMSRSLYRPRAKTAVEAFGQPYFHARSQRFYEMRRDGDRYTFHRFQKDSSGELINEIDIDVDWIVGSGNHSRVYLYQTDLGELYQLPIAWYADDGQYPARWGMAPGFDAVVHNGVRRIVQRECMFCHNAYPEVPQGSDLRGEPHIYPEDLPEGIGCQRCHGPGAEHVRVALADGGLGSTAGGAGTVAAGHRGGQDSVFEPVRSSTETETAAEPPTDPVITSIVNPGRLSPQRRDELCISCHMQPTVVIPGLRRFHRPDFSYRVGEPLHEYFVSLDVDVEGQAREDRFEINHHPYRLQQSRCYTESPAHELSCLTCHDPHRKVPKAQQAAHYRQACLGCHTLDACQLDAMTGNVPAALQEAAANNDCVSCHMPRHRPSDVIQVVMTDHKIQRSFEPEELLKRELEEQPIIVGIELTGEDRPQGHAGEVYRAVAVERAGGQDEATAHLERHLAPSGIEESEPWHQLLRGKIRTREFEAAVRLGRELTRRYPEDVRIRELLAIAFVGQGETERAEATLHQAVAMRPQRPEAYYNLGRVLGKTGREDEALTYLKKALELRPNFTSVWLGLAEVYRQKGDLALAREAYIEALTLEPHMGRAYASLVELLLEEGQLAEAQRWWLHGRNHAFDPQSLPDTLPVPEINDSASGLIPSNEP